MAIQTSAGMSLAIGTTQAATTITEFASDTYAPVGFLESIGDFGDTWTPIRFTGLNTRVTVLKGSQDGGDVAFSFAFDDSNAGQVALIAAHADPTGNYNIRISFSGGQIRYFKAKIMQLSESAPNADSILMVNGSMSINSSTAASGSSPAVGASTRYQGNQTLCLVGDSILDNYTQKSSYNESSYQMASGIVWANARMGWPFDILPPHTDSGGQIQEVAAKVRYYVNSLKAGWVVVNAGANSVDQTSPNLIRDWTTLIGAVERGEHKIIVMNILPQGNNVQVLTDVQIDGLIACNAYIKSYCAANGHIYVDAYSAIVDTTGKFARAGALTDSKHPATLGGYLIGEAFYQALKDRTDIKPLKFGRYPEYSGGSGAGGDVGLPGYIGQQHELVGQADANAIFEFTDGLKDANVTGIVARDWTANRVEGTGTAVASIVAADASDVDQTNWQRIRTNGDGTAGTRDNFEIVNQHTGTPILFTPGDWVQVYAELRADIGTTQFPFQLDIKFIGSAIGQVFSKFRDGGADWPNPGGAVDAMYLVFKLPPVQIPVDATGAFLKFNVRSDGAEAKTVDARNLKAYKVDPPSKEQYPGERIITIVGNNNYTLAGFEDRYESYVFNGTLTSTKWVKLPMRNSRLYTVTNLTGQTVTFKTENGTGIDVANNKTAMLKCNGTNIVRVTPDV